MQTQIFLMDRHYANMQSLFKIYLYLILSFLYFEAKIFKQIICEITEVFKLFSRQV